MFWPLFLKSTFEIIRKTIKVTVKTKSLIALLTCSVTGSGIKEFCTEMETEAKHRYPALVCTHLTSVPCQNVCVCMCNSFSCSTLHTHRQFLEGTKQSAISQ